MATVNFADAHASATRAKPDELARYLQDLLGQKLTALIAGIQDPKAVGAWAKGRRSPHPDAVVRLRAAYQIAELMLQAESPRTVRAWFVGMNPHLGDRAPALVIAEGNIVPAMQAARAFLASS